VLNDPEVGSSSSGVATLLERLLALLQEGGLRTPAELAQELSTSPALVEAMVEELTRRGYLQETSKQCVEHCRGCPLAGECAVAWSGRVWRVNDPARSDRPGIAGPDLTAESPGGY
jgi:hypothetical protein